MKAMLRSLASGCGLLAVGFVAGTSVGTARSEHRPILEQPGASPTLLAQASPSSPAAPLDKRATAGGVDMNALEKAMERAAKAALDKAAAEAVERIQKAIVPPELATLRQRIGELDRLRGEIGTEIAGVRATALRYAMWAGAGFFAVMVLASVVGGAIVAALFRPSRRA